MDPKDIGKLAKAVTRDDQMKISKLPKAKDKKEVRILRQTKNRSPEEN